VAILVDGDRKIEESKRIPEGIYGVDDGRMGVRGCSPTPESPGDVGFEAATESWDAGTVASVFALRRVDGGETYPAGFP
jgi:hypothetical protein